MSQYSFHLIDSKGAGSYLSVRGRTSWKTKRIAVDHAADIMNCKHKPWDTVIAEVENEFGEVIS